MRILICTIVAALGLSAVPVLAQEPVPNHPALQDRFYFGAGMFVPKTSTSAQLDTKAEVGTNVDFEQLLGMTTQKTVPEGFFRFRLNDRWRIDASYFQLNRSGDQIVDRQINWGDLPPIPIGPEVKSKFNFSDIRVSAGYAFFRTKDKELGVGLGFHVATYDVALNATSIGDEAKKVLAPLPVLSIYGQ